MSVRLVLVSRPSPARQHYQQALNVLRAEYDTVSGPSELFKALSKTPYNGVLIDTATELGITPREKRRLQTILEIFPVMRIDRNDTLGRVELSYFGQTKASDIGLDKFITSQAAAFEARTIRTHDRHDLHYNVTIYSNGHCRPEDGQRAVALDISEGGVFLVFLDNWVGQRQVWLRFMDFTDLTPVEGEVRRQVNWGVRSRIPGLGVSFTKISDKQLKEIQEDLKRLNE
ncbi:MAG: PilZ domain-containing protein [Proteobacteria bacterium]|nr:PilZ domain-containing protein [Pseudomonadota bacterium]